MYSNTRVRVVVHRVIRALVENSDLWRQCPANFRHYLVELEERQYCEISQQYFSHPGAKARYWKSKFGFESRPTFGVTGFDPERVFMPEFWTVLTSLVLTKAHEDLIPNDRVFQRPRERVVDKIQNHLESITRDLEESQSNVDIKIQLLVFGSSANNFGTMESDMDMCVVVSQTTESCLSDPISDSDVLKLLLDNLVRVCHIVSIYLMKLSILLLLLIPRFSYMTL